MKKLCSETLKTLIDNEQNRPAGSASVRNFSEKLLVL